MIEIFSNTSHIHLLLNHVPTTAFFAALVLFVIALMNGSDALKKTSLAMFVVVAVVTIATYTSGSAAEAWLRGTSVKSELPPNVVSAAIHEHEDSALWATVLMELTGFFAWLALWQWKSVRKRPAVEPSAGADPGAAVVCHDVADGVSRRPHQPRRNPSGGRRAPPGVPRARRRGNQASGLGAERA